jgi:RimJ/RimL family protein N-acetyltransferase
MQSWAGGGKSDMSETNPVLTFPDPLDGEKVRLRAYMREDLEKARTFLNDSAVGMTLRPGILFPFRPEDETKFYDSLDPGSATGYSFAIELKADATYIGGCGVMNMSLKNGVGTVGIFLGREFCSQGYGTDAMRTLVSFCFLEIALHKLNLNVFSFNKRAIRSYEKVGFRVEGVLREVLFRNGTHHDEVVMGLLRHEWEQIRKAS